MTESNQTTLTRESLLGRVRKPRFEFVDVPGMGVIGIRQRTRLLETKRAYRAWNDDGSLNEREKCLQPFYRIIDQVMVDEHTPMFTEEDLTWLTEMPEGDFDQLFAAVQKFNEDNKEPEPKKTAESNGSSEN